MEPKEVVHGCCPCPKLEGSTLQLYSGKEVKREFTERNKEGKK